MSAFMRSLGYYAMQNPGRGGVIDYFHGAFWKYLKVGQRESGTAASYTDTPPEVLQRIFNCPADTDFKYVGSGGGIDTSSSVLRNFTYTWNASFWCPPATDGTPNLFPPHDGYRGDTKPVTRVTQIVQPSRKIILEEEQHPNDGWSFVGWQGSGGGDDTPGIRHNKRYANWGFADTHVEALTARDVGYTDVNTPNADSSLIDTMKGAWWFHLEGSEGHP
jgi:prepilin-type processing-associated H-X9-DG protein